MTINTHDNDDDLSKPITGRLKNVTKELVKHRDHLNKMEEILKLTQDKLTESIKYNDILRNKIELLTSSCSWNDQCPVKKAMK